MDGNYWNAERWSRRAVIRRAGLATGGLAAAALVGCGGDEDDTPTATGAATSQSSGSPSASPEVSGGTPGGRLVLNQFGDPPSFDLHRESTTLTNYPTNTAYNQLVRFDPAIGAESPESVIGDLATDWEIAPDGQTYTFHLQEGIQYHDGTPFTAADVKASYDRQVNPPETLSIAPRGAQMQWIGAIDTPDDMTVVIHATRPVSVLSVLPIFAQSWMAIYSQKDVEGGFDFMKGINGTGPYALQT